MKHKRALPPPQPIKTKRIHSAPQQRYCKTKINPKSPHCREREEDKKEEKRAVEDKRID